DGNGNPDPECTRPAVPDARGLVDLEADPMAESMAEVVPVTGGGDQVAGRRVDRARVRAGSGRLDPGPLRRGHKLVDLPLPGRGLAERHGPGHVRVVAVVAGAAVDRDQVPRRERPVAGRVMRDRAVRAAG